MRIPSEIKVLPIDPLFSNWVNFFYLKSVYHKLFYKFKQLSGHLFFFDILKISFTFLAFMILFQLSVGYVFFLSFVEFFYTQRFFYTQLFTKSHNKNYRNLKFKDGNLVRFPDKLLQLKEL